MQLIWLSPIPEQIHQSSTQSGCCFSDWKYSFNLIQKQKMFYEKQTYLSWQEFFLLSSGICWWRRSSFLNLGFLFCWTSSSSSSSSSSPSSSSSSPSSSSSSWLLAPVSSTLFSPRPWLLLRILLQLLCLVWCVAGAAGWLRKWWRWKGWQSWRILSQHLLFLLLWQLPVLVLVLVILQLRGEILLLVLKKEWNIYLFNRWYQYLSRVVLVVVRVGGKWRQRMETGLLMGGLGGCLK